MISDQHLQEIYNSAKTVNSRKWQALKDGNYCGVYWHIIGEKENPKNASDDDIVTSLMVTDSDGYDYEAGIFDENVARHIAACSPEVIMELVEELHELRSYAREKAVQSQVNGPR